MLQLLKVSPEILFVVFTLWSILVFYCWKSDVALCVVVVTGWLFLPIAPRGQFVNTEGFPFWLIGLALPSQIWLSKVVVIGIAGLIGSLLCQFRVWRSLRWSWLDLPILVWCLWPLTGFLVEASPRPSPLFSSAYLCATWGSMWLLARVHLNTHENQLTLALALALGVVACLPFAILEGIFNLQIYSDLFELHPFASDGRVRYVFFRPIGFFEHGNQYGLWVCSGVVGAYAAMRALRRKRHSGLLFSVTVLVAVIAQSVGAIFLAAFSIFGGLFWSRWRLGRALAGVAGGAVLLAAVYFSGALPIERLARETAVGQNVLQVFRSMGRGSLPWRVSQDQKALPLIKDHLAAGHHTWDWWRPVNARPWGLVLLSLGQFGLAGMVAMLLVWLLPMIKTLSTSAKNTPEGQLSIYLALILGMTVLDAFMNSFIFFPSIMIAGALAAPARLATDRELMKPPASWASGRQMASAPEPPRSLADFAQR